MVFGLDYSNNYNPNYDPAVGEHLNAFQRTQAYFAQCAAASTTPVGTTTSVDAQDAAFNPHDMPPDSFIHPPNLPTPPIHQLPFKLVVVGPTIDPFCSEQDAQDIFAQYSAVSPDKTLHIVLQDGPHVSGGKTTIEGPDSGFTCINQYINSAITAQSLSGSTVSCTMDHPFQNYQPIPPEFIWRAIDVPRWIDAQFSSLPEFRWYSVTNATCDGGGSVAWYTDENGIEQLTFIDCVFVPNWSVSGSGTFDWNTPDAYVYGYDVSLNLAVSRGSSHHQSCFSYSHITNPISFSTVAVACA
jgi:hypothetical protein